MLANVAPVVSICVTTYRHAPFIRRCMESVLTQLFDGDLELLVGDDGSTDGTREIIAEFAARDPRVVPVFHQHNLGPTGNLESLVSRAKGKYAIAHLDGDDAWEPGKLLIQLALLAQLPEVVAVYTNAKVVTPDDRPLGVFNAHAPARINLTELLRRGNFLNHSSLLYRAEAREAVLDMLPPWIDYRLHIRLAARGVLAYIDEPLVLHRWRTPNSMIKTMPRAVFDGQIDAFNEALVAGAPAMSVRRAAGHAWGKAFVHALLTRDAKNLRYFSDRLEALTGLQADARWRAGQAVIAPVRAVHSIWSRRRGVYFP